ncbi:MAG: heme lyase CcmF/NrfE family subunit, partial [Acidobacteria bacterium]|nr:heme lyase CcmF/NrfE family subunit [Acidobacteriota bacterium]
MLAEIGRHCLTLSLLCAAWAALAGFLGGKFHHFPVFISARRSLYAGTGLLVAASAILIHANLTNNFSLWVVASYSNINLPTFYKVSAMWGSQAGSLLLWALILSCFSSIVVFQYRRRNDDMIPFVASILGGILVFFLILLNFNSNPFTMLASPPLDGNGLNPQLQTPLMVIHPPLLYIGYVGFSIPFAFAIAALLSGRLNDVWIHRTRRWTIFSWFFLGIGILLGAYWAYIELGWGGYWAWDPVENAALVPWLTATAFLHSVMIQEKKRMLQTWNMVLVILTYCLCILGTFITRSGIISSVHSFTVSNLGPLFLVFLAILFGASFLLLVYRLPELKSPNKLNSLVSRESSFLFNNLFLLACAFAILWGTLFPILSEAVRGVKITVGPPFFNQVIAPIGLALIFLTGVCPLIAWRRATLKHLLRNFRYPVGAGMAGALLLPLFGFRQVYSILAISLCLFVFATIILEFFRGTQARHRMTGEPSPLAFFRLINRNRRRYGGYLVHLGILFMVVGITGSWNYQQ